MWDVVDKVALRHVSLTVRWFASHSTKAPHSGRPTTLTVPLTPRRAVFEFYMSVARAHLWHVSFSPYFKIRFWMLLQNIIHDLLAVDQVPFLKARNPVTPRPGCHVMCG